MHPASVLFIMVPVGEVGNNRRASSVRELGLAEGLDHRPMKPGEQETKLETAARTLAESRPRHRSVLLVESDPDLQWSLARMLTVNGNRVVGTSSGEGALAVIEQWQPDLALVSATIPSMSGVDIARALRMKNPDLVVILMDEPSPEPDATARARDASPAIAGRLPKPFRFEVLRALLDSLQLAPAPAE